ncbi:MAG: 4Fe-4S binding protein [Archaeoglobaceae archaeon]|nr:4Fe-4S binding protein [Archaeoglobaceae archaeon]
MKVEFKVKKTEMLKRHINVIREAFKQAVAPERVTVEYPRERRRYSSNFRGLIGLNHEKCISCFRCAHICPANAIQMTFYEKALPGIDYTKCIFCHFCVESCPSGALKATKIHDIAFARMEDMKLSASQIVRPPEIVREDATVVEYVIDEKGWRVVKKPEVDELYLETFFVPVKRRISTCVDPESCLGCKICVDSCPTQALIAEVERNRLRIEMKKCTGCGICVRNCPMKVLELKEVS